MGPKSSIKSEFATPEDKVQFEDDLIRLVQPHPHLWDLKNLDYKNKGKRQNTFATIGEDLCKSGEVCLKVWEGLRSQYLACRRSLPTGSEGSARPSFRHFETMGFISGNSVTARTWTNVGDDAIIVDPEGTGIIRRESEPESGIAVIGPNSPQANGSLPPPDKQTPRPHAKFGGKRKLEPLEEELLTFVKGGPPKDDQFELFGKNIAAKLRLIHEKDPKEQIRCQFKIHEIIFEAELGLF